MATGTNLMTSTGVDVRLNSAQGHHSDYIPPQSRATYDKTVTFEEYHFYAQACRRDEAVAAKPAGMLITSIWDTIIPGRKKDHQAAAAREEEAEAVAQHMPEGNINRADTKAHVTDEEWINASRALRLATWGSMFYLITTDILGPFALPYAIATTGWGPGIGLYTVFGALAGYSGYLLWRMYMGLDSYQYPLRNFGDLGFRIFGPWVRYLFNVLQSIQLLANVGVLVIANGQSLSQVAKFKLCYAVCCVIWAVVGFGVGQVRTLKNYGWLANSAIWINVLTIFITMGVVANTPPNYTAAQTQSAGAAIAGAGGPLVAQLPDGSYPAVTTSGGQPSTGFTAAVVGLMQAVYSYGGSMVFIEFMSEMRRPYDFIKAMWGAQAFIYFFYMFYGSFVYGYQGQYTINPSYQGLSVYHWQVVGNVLNMVASIIAAGLYGNIGIKVLYNNILAELLHFPPLTTKAGRWIWAAVVPVYWSIAFILAAAIPNFSGLTTVIAALCILHFTYSFPPILYLGYKIQRDTLRNLNLCPKTNHSAVGKPNEDPHPSIALPPPEYNSGDEKKGDTAVAAPTASPNAPPPGGYHAVLFRPATGVTQEQRSAARRKAIVSSLPVLTWLMIYFLGALVTSGLGSYAGIEALIAAFANGSATAFTCLSPLDA